jgi:hypothetical protein
MPSIQEIKEFAGFIKEFRELLMAAHFPSDFSVNTERKAYFLGSNPAGQVLFSHCRVTRVDMFVSDLGTSLLVYIDGGHDAPMEFNPSTGKFRFMEFTGMLHWN